MNRTRKAATVKTDDDEPQDPLNEPLQAFLIADLYASICTGWQSESERLPVHPCHHTLGLST
jgi:hypothetical protein